jgi:predicted naringenin-chalcone synthase
MFALKTKGCYVLSNDIWTPPLDLSLSVEDTAEMLSTVLDGKSTEETVSILSSLPLSDRTFLPAGYHQRPIQLSIHSAGHEIGHTFESFVKPSLAKHGYSGKDVTVVVAACSTYASVPPQSARLCNILGCKSDVTGLNMTGTGNSMAVTALTTAAAMLRARPEPGVAVVAISENMSTLLYGGRDARFLESNASKRLGCACIILSTHRSDKRAAKYKVCETATTSKFFWPGEMAESFEVDDDGVFGFRRNVPFACEENLIDQVRIAYDNLNSQAGGLEGANHVIVDPSHPHTIRLGYKALDMEHCAEEQESSMNAFHAFGDVGPAACWYGLAHREASRGVKKGERVMLMAISSNLYTGAVILEAYRNIKGTWEAQADPACVREMFQRYYKGLQPQRALLKRVSEREEMLQKVDRPMFYPYTHGIWLSDMTRFKDALIKLEPLYNKLNFEEPTPPHTVMTVEA